jgi:hypothetical protein
VVGDAVTISEHAPEPNHETKKREWCGLRSTRNGHTVRIRRHVDHVQQRPWQQVDYFSHRLSDLNAGLAVIGSHLSGDCVPRYRAYLPDEDGRIANAIDMECADDVQAKECASKCVSGRSAEFWQEDRLIATYAK